MANHFVMCEMSQLDRIEAKLDALLAALAEEDGESPVFSLGGEPVPSERNQDDEL